MFLLVVLTLPRAAQYFQGSLLPAGEHGAKFFRDVSTYRDMTINVHCTFNSSELLSSIQVSY